MHLLLTNVNGLNLSEIYYKVFVLQGSPFFVVWRWNEVLIARLVGPLVSIALETPCLDFSQTKVYSLFAMLDTFASKVVTDGRDHSPFFWKIARIGFMKTTLPSPPPPLPPQRWLRSDLIPSCRPS